MDRGLGASSVFERPDGDELDLLPTDEEGIDVSVEDGGRAQRHVDVDVENEKRSATASFIHEPNKPQ